MPTSVRSAFSLSGIILVRFNGAGAGRRQCAPPPPLIVALSISTGTNQQLPSPIMSHQSSSPSLSITAPSGARP